MTTELFLAGKLSETVASLYAAAPDASQIQIQPTRKDFEGDLTAVMFPLLKISRKSPEATATEVGEALKAGCPEIASFNVIKGFLNISFSPAYWSGVLNSICDTPHYGQWAPSGRRVMVEFSSPNTNKPLHLGHVRNNLLGWSVSRLLAACGDEVIKVNLVNDRGIHICKSMLAWLKAGNGETPETSGKKGDHLVGDCYVAYNNLFNAEVEKIMAERGVDREEAEKLSELQKEAREMLFKWEQGDPGVRALWEKMNGWVYDGFAKTYSDLGISFDRTYYESQTYLFGKDLVRKGLDTGVFERREDGSVWCNLEADGLDRKLLLRGDGTSVYMTQDLGTASRRYDEYHFDEHIYVVGNEQNYHFQVLKLILKKLGFDWSDSIYHLSYGMVELPNGKMKSREGTVVDADDLMQQMYQTAKDTSLELGKLEGMDSQEQERLFRMLGLGALKYFIIKVDPRKTMLFDPAESIDFNGNTGPFIQYTHARIRSILRKAEASGFKPGKACGRLTDKEIELIKLLASYPSRIKEGGQQHSPAVIANFAYDLAKEFNQYYHATQILREEDTELLSQRLMLIEVTARVLVSAMDILGIELPERM